MSKTIPFEESMAQLQTIVSQLEKGDLSLEDSLLQFEKGISLARECQSVLNKAEQKIEILSAAKTNPESDSLDE